MDLKAFLKGVSLSLVIIFLVSKRYLKKVFIKPQFRQSFGVPNRARLIFNFRRRHILGLLSLILLLFSLWYFQVEFIPRRTISQGVVGVFSKEKLVSSDRTQNLPVVIANLLSEPLVVIDQNGKAQAKLVTGWQTNNNSTFYSFRLKNNLYWNDGTKLVSSDIRFELPDIEVSYPDQQTIDFTLPDSYSAFPSLLTYPIFKGSSLVGVGQFEVISEQLLKGLVVKLILQPKNNQDRFLPKVQVRFYPDENTAKTAFTLGEVDSLFLSSEGEEFLGQPTIQTFAVTNFSKVVAIFYNTKDSLLADKNLRKALNSATPQIEGEERAKTSINPSSWAFNSEVKDNLESTESAKNYLSRAEKKDETVVLTTTGNFSKLGEKVVASWKESGVPAVLRIESGNPQNFQALLNQQSIPQDPDQYSLWHSTQTKTNISKYDSKRADKDLEDGRKTSDLEKRKENYLDLQKVLADDVPATFLYFPKTFVVYRTKFNEDLQQVLGLQLIP